MNDIRNDSLSNIKSERLCTYSTYITFTGDAIQ